MVCFTYPTFYQVILYWVVGLVGIGVLFGCVGRKIDGPGLPGGLIIYQGHLFILKGRLCWWGICSLVEDKAEKTDQNPDRAAWCLRRWPGCRCRCCAPAGRRPKECCTRHASFLRPPSNSLVPIGNPDRSCPGQGVNIVFWSPSWLEQLGAIQAGE